MLKPDERDLEGGCEGSQSETKEGQSISDGSEKSTVSPKIKRCAVCRERFQIPDDTDKPSLRYLCIKCRKVKGLLEPRHSYSVQVHIGDPGLYYVQKLPLGLYGEEDWYTVKRYLNLVDAYQYIYERTGER